MLFSCFMNLGNKPALQNTASINLATSIGALLNLQGFGLGQNPQGEEVNFEAVLAKANVGNELSVESNIVPPQNNQVSLDQTLGSIISDADEVKFSSPQFNSDTVVDSPTLAPNSKELEIHKEPVVINYPSLLQEFKNTELAANELPKELEDAFKEFEAELLPSSNNLNTDNAKPVQANFAAVAPQQMPILQENSVGAQKIVESVKHWTPENVVIASKVNMPIKPIAIDGDKGKGGEAPRKLEIKTALPVNSRELQLIQDERFMASIDNKLGEDMREDQYLASLDLEPKEVTVLAEKPQSFASLLKIGQYKDRELPVEQRSEQITHQVVKVISNLETKTQTISVQLDPADLGKVDIKMEISPKGEAKVQILADRIETYAFLSKASDQIQEILNDKGFNGDSTSLNFGLRHGNQNNQQNQQNLAFSNFSQGTEAAERDNLEIKLAHMFYSDPNRLDIRA